MYTYFLLLGLIACQGASAIWTCSQDDQCSSISGGVCRSGVCTCPAGQQTVMGGTTCADLAPYHQSPCQEDHQCSRMATSYVCQSQESGDGVCSCQPGNHFFRGRCWKTLYFGEQCSQDEECMGPIQDPYSLKCNGTCQCADGYFLRQREECRKIALAVGERCVLDQDCQFTGGACDVNTFSCYNVNDRNTKLSYQTLNVTYEMAAKNMAHEKAANNIARQHGVECDTTNPCQSPFECSSFGVCICPRGYYSSQNGANCLADLGSPSTPEQCVGLLAEVFDGVCKCPSNFYYEDNMRDCIKVTRQITDSCTSDSNCHTFGVASRCGPPTDPWGFRYCECIPEDAVWDANQNMCRLFAGIGEACEVDSDCLAGELEIQCRLNEDGQGFCSCPDNLQEVDGLCLTTGLELGDSCQATFECTGTENTECSGSICSCVNGYIADNGVCAPVIGGSCTLDSDCLIQNTACKNTTAGLTCQCSDNFLEYDGVCWPVLSGVNDTCSISDQCRRILGEDSQCLDGECECNENYHQRDGSCWLMIELFASCSRTSQCYLGENSKLTVCRNGICQCDFDYPFSEETGTCTSSASILSGSILLMLLSTLILLKNQKY